jgi:hypothetical protein
MGVVMAACRRREQSVLFHLGRAMRTTEAITKNGTISRKQAARSLGVSVATVRRMEGVDLHPNIVDGVHAFDPVEVEDLARRRSESRNMKRNGSSTNREAVSVSGEVAAVAFSLFASGRSTREVVVELHLHPVAVRDLHANWVAMGYEILVSCETRNQLQKLLDQGIVTENDVLRAVREGVTASRELDRFVFPCFDCGQPMRATAGLWGRLLRAGALKRFRHKSCPSQ